MKFEEQLRFDQPREQVLRMYADPAYFERKYDASGARDVAILEQERTERQFRIKCRYTTESDVPLPEFARKFISGAMTVVQQDTWDLVAFRGRVEIEPRGAPVKISAEMELRDAPGGCVNHIQWTVSCALPLIGGKLEKAVAEDVRMKSRKDHAVSQQLLKDYSG